MDDLLKKAVDPHQYDTKVIDWNEEGAEDSPTRKYFRYYLLPELDVEDKSVLDIGCGIGHMVKSLEERGVKKITGIDPSENSIQAALTKHPNQTFTVSTLEEYSTEEKFDVAISIMVFEHIEDLNNGFKKVHSLLHDDGLFYLIVGDLDYLTTPRMNYDLEVRKLDNDTFVTKTERSFGVIYDVLRTVEAYVKNAETARFSLKKHIPIAPNDELIELLPRYKDFKDVPNAHLLVFQKV